MQPTFSPCHLKVLVQDWCHCIQSLMLLSFLRMSDLMVIAVADPSVSGSLFLQVFPHPFLPPPPIPGTVPSAHLYWHNLIKSVLLSRYCRLLGTWIVNGSSPHLNTGLCPATQTYECNLIWGSIFVMWLKDLEKRSRWMVRLGPKPT